MKASFLAISLILLGLSTPRTSYGEFLWLGDWQGDLSSPPSADVATARALARRSNLDGTRGIETHEILFQRSFRVTEPTKVVLTTRLVGSLVESAPGPGGSVQARVTASASILNPTDDLEFSYDLTGTQLVDRTDSDSHVFEAGGTYTVLGRLLVQASVFTGPTTATSDFSTGDRRFEVDVTAVPEPTSLRLLGVPLLGLLGLVGARRLGAS